MFVLNSNHIVLEQEESIRLTLKERGITPSLHVILVGDFEPSLVYVKHKQKACLRVGIACIIHKFTKTIDEKTLLNRIEQLNTDASVHAILIQLPLPEHIDSKIITEAIDYKKDVDGLTSINFSRLVMGVKGIIPCTPMGCLDLMKSIKISLKGLHAVIVGRSNLVGKPLLHLLLREDMTVTCAHSQTQNLKDITKQADVLIVAIGKQHFITTDFVKQNAIVIDVGINRHSDGLCGDVDFDSVKHIVHAVTPVPGGVGPMTVLNLLKNTLLCYELQDA